MRATSAFARQRPSTIELLLTDSLFVAAYQGGRRTEVPMNGDDVELDMATSPTRAKVEWKDGQPRLKWLFEGGGEVVDRYEILPSGRMLLTRVFNLGVGGDVEARFYYDRDS